MSKWGPIIALGIAAPCTVVGGFYLAKSTNIDATLPESLDEFKNKDGGYCVQSLFPGMKEMKKDDATAVSSTNKIDNTTLFKDTSSSPTEGCLVINWEKDTYSKGDKFKGNFRFLWAMKKGNQGFIVFTKATSPKDEKTSDKIKWEGVAYTVKQEETTWSIDKKKEVASKEMDKSDAKTKFLMAGEKMDDFSKDSAFGFIKPSTDADKMCGTSDCTEASPTKSSFKGYWKWANDSSSEAKTADAWSSNLDSWWGDVYSKDDWDMTGVLSNVKGSWTKVLTNSNPTTTSTVSK